MSAPAEVVDTRGLRCPLPVIRLAAAARAHPPGAVLVLLASDPAAVHDVPAWARLRGHSLLACTELAGGPPTTWRIAVRLTEGPPAAP